MKRRPVWPIVAVLWVTAGALAPDHGEAQDAGSHPYVSPWKTPWDYEGPRGSAHWSELDPAYAACDGKEQSPIDIRHTEKAALPPLHFDYHAGPIENVINNGHTIRVNYHAPGSGDFLVVDGTRYQLTQFHFHRPSEEQVNGKAYDMVLHLMHQTSDGKVAGVAVFLTAGKPNAAIQELWDHMPSAEGQNFVGALPLNPVDLLPSDTSAYYLYLGSVTAPPCTEGVTWFVLKRPVTLSRAQIDAFAALYPNDVRQPQPLNGRIVKESR
jgi:carbonic anhydrase